MSEQDKQDATPAASNDAEVKSPDSQSDDVSTTNETDISSELEGEENKELDLDSVEAKSESPNKAKEQRDKQIGKWSERYYNGEIELSEAPKWIQKIINEADTPSDEELFDKRFEERAAAMEDKKSYMANKKVMNDSSMTAEQKKTLVDTFKTLKSRGVPPGEASTFAMKVAGISTAKKDMPNAPKTSGRENKIEGGKDQSYMDKTKNMTNDEKIAYLQELTGY